MLLSTVADWVRERVKGANDATLLRELNAAWTKIWLLNDTPDSYQEVTVENPGTKHITLPWFVNQVVGVRRGASGPKISLYTPRAFYGQVNSWQSEFQWALLHRTPLLRAIDAAGQLTIKLRKRISKPVAVAVRGTGEYGVSEIETVNIGAGLLSATTQGIYHDISVLSSPTRETDIEVHDIANNLIALIPSDRTDVLCQIARLETTATAASTQACNCYDVLFKRHAPTFTSFNDTVPDDLGLLLQAATAAELLRTSDEQIRQNRAGTLDRQADVISNALFDRNADGKDLMIKSSPSPYYNRRYTQI